MANALEATVRIGVLLLLAAWCFSIIQPFVIPIVWGVIIAVAEYPGYLKLREWLGGRATTAATLLTALGLLVLLVRRCCRARRRGVGGDEECAHPRQS